MVPISLWALFSTTAFIWLWFKMTRREFQARWDTVESSKIHLAVCRQKFMAITDSAEKEEAKFILLRSEDIYSQSLWLYNQMLYKPQNIIPSLFLGFRKLPHKKS